MQVEEVPETGLTFVENALIKARNTKSVLIVISTHMRAINKVAILRRC